MNVPFDEWCSLVLELEGVTGLSGHVQGRPVVMVESEQARHFVRAVVGHRVPVVVTGVLWRESSEPAPETRLVPLRRR